MWTNFVMAGMSSLTLSDLEGMSYYEIYLMRENISLINSKEKESYEAAASTQ